MLNINIKICRFTLYAIWPILKLQRKKANRRYKKKPVGLEETIGVRRAIGMAEEAGLRGKMIAEEVWV